MTDGIGSGAQEGIGGTRTQVTIPRSCHASHLQWLPATTLSMPVCIGASLKVGGMGV